MRRLIALLLGIVIGGTLVYGGFHYHVARTTDRFLLVPKLQASLDDAYVDLRHWSAADWGRHPRLVRALISAGHGELVMTHLSDGLVRDLFRSFGDRSAREPDRLLTQ